MRAIANVSAMSVCMLLIGTPLAFADDVSEELAEMRTMVEQLRGQVDAQSEQIAHQGDVIREARLEQGQRSDSRFGSSGIAAFLQRLVVDGHVAGSYFYNFNDPGAGGVAARQNTGASLNVYPFHPHHNNFQVDQAWFGIEHPVDEENRAGFRFDLVYGTTACALGNEFFGAGSTRCTNFGGNDESSQYYVDQAYVQYLAPLTANGILIKAGKWRTLVGAEVANTTANFNITRGNVYSILQPNDHVGVLASTDIGETDYSATFGFMNDDHNGPTLATGSDPDNNESKSIVVQLGWSGETISASSTLLWGYSQFASDDESDGLLDLLLTWDPNEKISAWINWDYAWSKVGFVNSHAWGLALAGRYAVTERMGVSSRFEFVRDDGSFAGWVNVGGGGVPSNSEIYSLTGTVDYALTSNLMLRGELRYDNITKDGIDNEFRDKGGDFRPDQTTAGVELVYEF